MPVALRFRTLAVAVTAGSLSMGAVTACSDAAGSTPDLAPVGTTAGPAPGGSPGVVPRGAPTPEATPRLAPPLWPGHGSGPTAPGGALSLVPQRGVAAGGGSTSGVEDLGLAGAGTAALVGAGALGLVSRRRERA